MELRSPKRRAARDVLLASAVVLLGAILFTHLDVAESLSAATSRGEAFEVDDVLLTLGLALLATAWIAMRRHADAHRRAAALRASEQARLCTIERLGALSARLMSAEADERQRIAVVLHDAVSQPLYAARLRLDAWLEQHAIDVGSPLISEARDLLEAAMRQGRDLTTELSPPGLHDLPFVEALETMAAQLTTRYGMTMRIERDGPWVAILGDHRVPLYEGIRELLTNAGKHAGAANVVVSASKADRGVVVQVRDDGRGFDPTLRRGPGFGLLSIEQRLARIGITLGIESSPGAGTRAMMRMHVQESEATTQPALPT